MSGGRERWAPISEWPGYEVSDRGRVRSFRRGANGRVLSAFSDRDGYQKVNVCNGARRLQVAVHRLVIDAFGSGAGEVVRHLDGDPSNNRISNLKWGSFAENEADKRRHGTAIVGERHHASKLTSAEVRRIRASSESGAALASRYGVAAGTIYSIRRRATWGHVR